MPSPTPEAVAAVTVAASLPFIGPTASIVVVAVFGAMVALSRQPKGSVAASVKFVFRAVAFSLLFTAIAAKVLHHFLSELVPFEVAELVLPVAFLIALIGDDWFKVQAWGLGWLSRKSKDGDP